MQNIKEEQKMDQPTRYDKFAQTYAHARLNYNQKSYEAYHEQFNFELKDKKLLDLGCGDGSDLKVFAERGAIIYGVDASKSMVELALKNTNQKAIIKEAYFENTSFFDNYFDVVCSKYAFQASKDIQLIYKEVNRLLKSGGIFIFLVGHPIYQFMEKRKHPKDYFSQEMNDVKLFGDSIIIREPTHTLNEYLSPYFIKHFTLETYKEEFEHSVEKINGDTYPVFLILKSIRK